MDYTVEEILTVAANEASPKGARMLWDYAKRLEEDATSADPAAIRAAHEEGRQLGRAEVIEKVKHALALIESR